MAMVRTGFLLLALVAAGACASTGAVPRPFPGAPAPPSAPAPPAAATPSPAEGGAAAGYAIAGTALSLRGVPYKNGGSDPSGFDCSGFVEYVFAQNGIALPRTVRDQFEVGHPVKPDDLQPGDLVFFTTVASGPSHVGIVIGGDQFVDAPSSRGEVRIDRLSADYWSRRFVGARRNW
jgi:cell wall-associated NlpC family hydrolase